MKKVFKFIREFNLKNLRKLRCISAEDLGKRFTIDSNAYAIVFETELADSYGWEMTIIKSHGKYTITTMRIDGNEIFNEKTWVTSKDTVVENLINTEIMACDDFCVKNKHIEDLHWKILKSPSDLYDGEEVIDFGELPKGFEKIPEELEPVPEYITID